MMQATFDRDYSEDLQDIYRRNECIREQHYLSPAKLLHLAAFCVSNVATEIDRCEEPHPTAPPAEAAFDAARQLMPLHEEGIHADVRSERVIVNGCTDGDRHDVQPRMTTGEAGATIERSIGRVRRLKAAAGLSWCVVAGENG